MFCRPWADELATTPLNHTNILLAQLGLIKNYIYYIKVVVQSITKWFSSFSFSAYFYNFIVYGI